MNSTPSVHSSLMLLAAARFLLGTANAHLYLMCPHPVTHRRAHPQCKYRCTTGFECVCGGRSSIPRPWRRPRSQRVRSHPASLCFYARRGFASLSA
ncbi:hypothetical protein DFH06DRAFT_1261911 [Mycena polygramma]|nr:hypothetical protein DFH06DRAFT_1261908 [Mycena polygramma]KAJ7601571.1 hypothetical protein DFH06DRAFT_1261909 [Mycena polygramma]KAJ7601572.1 hypothetical protein DFH06DRAFT_1261910 [Mycena polygramma]KAJ7601573.1 hypothetical protein DFH06DRAFT_1261911 [Mycena polygramma]